MENPKPKVLIKGVNIANIRKIGADQNHLKITLEDSGSTLDGVGFGLGIYVIKFLLLQNYRSWGNYPLMNGII